MKNELELTKYLQKHFKTIFPYYQLVGFGKAVYGCVSGEYMGLVDLIMRKGQRLYLVEIKHNPMNGTSNFWDSLKVLGYSKAFNLMGTKNIKPVVMVEKSVLSQDCLPILYELGVGYITFNREDNGETVFETYLHD